MSEPQEEAVAETIRIRINPHNVTACYVSHPLIPDREYKAGEVIEIPAFDHNGVPVTAEHFEGMQAGIEIVSDEPTNDLLALEEERRSMAMEYEKRIEELESELETEKATSASYKQQLDQAKTNTEAN